MRAHISKARNRVPGKWEIPINVERGERRVIIVKAKDAVRYEIHYTAPYLCDLLIFLSFM